MVSQLLVFLFLSPFSQDCAEKGNNMRINKWEPTQSFISDRCSSDIWSYGSACWGFCTGGANRPPGMRDVLALAGPGRCDRACEPPALSECLWSFIVVLA